MEANALPPRRESHNSLIRKRLRSAARGKEEPECLRSGEATFGLQFFSEIIVLRWRARSASESANQCWEDLGNSMGRRSSELRKRVVEDCDVITPSNHRLCDRLGIKLTATMPRSFVSFRYWLQCPSCGRRCFKLYRPDPSSGFACRECHQLTYRSAQRHDARLGRFLKMSDDELESIIENRNDRECDWLYERAK